MPVDSIKSLLAQADAALDKISVKGDDVFAMADARRKLKQAFDAVDAAQHKPTDHEYNNRKDDPT